MSEATGRHGTTVEWLKFFAEFAIAIIAGLWAVSWTTDVSERLGEVQLQAAQLEIPARQRLSFAPLTVDAAAAPPGRQRFFITSSAAIKNIGRARMAIRRVTWSLYGAPDSGIPESGVAAHLLAPPGAGPGDLRWVTLTEEHAYECSWSTGDSMEECRGGTGPLSGGEEGGISAQWVVEFPERSFTAFAVDVTVEWSALYDDGSTGGDSVPREEAHGTIDQPLHLYGVQSLALYDGLAAAIYTPGASAAGPE